MKRFINLIAIIALVAVTVASCNKYDDSAIKSDLNDLTGRVSALESKVDAANSNINALQTSVSVLEGKTSISGVEQTSDGYAIKFSDGKSVTIKDGGNGSTPAIGIKKDADGNYYWTLNGEWLLADGQKVLAGQASPQLRIEDGKWMVSVDGGKIWTDAAPSSEYVIFKSVDISNPAFVTLTLQDGTVLKLTRGVSGVQSIAVIPDYSDVSVKVTDEENIFKFYVFPESATEAVAALPLDRFDVKVVYTETKAAAGDEVALPVAKVSSDKGKLLVTVYGSSLDRDFFSRSLSASAILVINDGTTCVQSGYFNLYGIPYKAVDLGLSVKWANCNVGATKPEEYGDYFAWGETKPKTYYHYSTYFDYSYEDGFMKYTDWDPTEKSHFEPEDDAAHVNWGGNWKVPSVLEFDELFAACEWNWIENYKGTGVTGYVVTGENGNSIFLPAAGGRFGSTLEYAGTDCMYMSSSINADLSPIIFDFWRDKYYNERMIAKRWSGFSVRPVTK